MSETLTTTRTSRTPVTYSISAFADSVIDFVGIISPSAGRDICLSVVVVAVPGGDPLGSDIVDMNAQFRKEVTNLTNETDEMTQPPTEKIRVVDI